MANVSGKDKAIIIGRSMNNAILLSVHDKVNAEDVGSVAEELVELELELYAKFGAGQDGASSGNGNRPSKTTFGGSSKPSPAPQSSGGSGQGPRPSDKQYRILTGKLGWTQEQIQSADFAVWKQAVQDYFDSLPPR